MWLVGGLLSLVSATAQAHRPAVRVVALDPSMEALGDVVDGELVYVDAVWPAADDDRCRDAAFGGLRQDADTVISVGPPEGDNHLLLEIRPGPRTLFPFNDVSCEYQGGAPLEPVLRVRGFYVVLSTSIPTARLVRLHAVALDPVVASRVIRDQ
ncbi:MAG: hypothetical protein KTR31_05815 [Myxococcales bacterium]|nr:hypothetical protein [Myxococcales bacterium]